MLGGEAARKTAQLFCICGDRAWVEVCHVLYLLSRSARFHSCAVSDDVREICLEGVGGCIIGRGVALRPRCNS